jgi:hypothetical protein
MSCLARLALAVALTAASLVPAHAADKTAMSQTDLLGREIGFGIGQTALDTAAAGVWLGASTGRSTVDPSGGQETDADRRDVVLGYGFGETGFSAFAGYGQGASELADDIHKARIRSYFLGLTYGRTVGRLAFDGAAYVGRSHNVIDSPDTATGAADRDGRLLGLTLRGSGMLMDDGAGHGIDFVVQGDALHHTTKAYPVSGLPSATVDERDSTATALRLEVGAPMTAAGASLRPFLGLTAFGGQQDEIAVSGMAPFDAVDVLSKTQMSLGMSFKAQALNGLGGRVELTSDDKGHTGFNAGFSLNF